LNGARVAKRGGDLRRVFRWSDTAPVAAVCDDKSSDTNSAWVAIEDCLAASTGPTNGLGQHDARQRTGSGVRRPVHGRYRTLTCAEEKDRATNLTFRKSDKGFDKTSVLGRTTQASEVYQRRGIWDQDSVS
jgi:hypothetical protein